MYAVYNYAAGATMTNIVNDVAAILTGTTDKTQLSAACVQANTTILTTYDQAGWTMHDSAAGTSTVCLKAPVADNASQYKYCVINGSAQANTIGFSLYEGWNATTHVGTNPGEAGIIQSARASKWAPVNTTYSGYLYISASARRILVLPFVNSIWGNSSSCQWMGLAERTRDMYWDTVAAGYLPAVGINSGDLSGQAASCFSTRTKDVKTGADVVSSAIGLSHVGKSYGSSMSSTTMPNVKVYNASGILSYLTTPLIVGDFANQAWAGSNVSVASDVLVFQPGFGARLDEINISGKDYVVWFNGTTNVNGSILVPKG